MAQRIEGTKLHLLKRRLEIIQDLEREGFTSADIALIFFGVNRATISDILRYGYKQLKQKKKINR